MVTYTMVDDNKEAYFIGTSFVLVFFVFFVAADYMAKSVEFQYPAPVGYALINYAMPIVLVLYSMLLISSRNVKFFWLAVVAMVLFVLLHGPEPVNALGTYLSQFSLFVY